MINRIFDVATAPAKLALKAAGQLTGRGTSAGPEEESPPQREERQQQQRRQQAKRQRPNPQRSTKPKDLPDVTIARKVESEIFRGEDRPKDKVDVNVVDGEVYLRGEVKTPDLINALETEARQIPEVKQVHNLLHLPNTPAPTRADTPKRAQKTRRTTAQKPRTEPRRLNADKSVQEDAHADQRPEDLAAAGKGRQPAPLGSQDS
jgi:BON domain-containing protein